MQHKIRRILAALLVVVLLVTMLPVNTAFVDASTSAGIERSQEQQEDTEKPSIEQSVSEVEDVTTQPEKVEVVEKTEKDTQEGITSQTIQMRQQKMMGKRIRLLRSRWSVLKAKRRQITQSRRRKCSRKVKLKR